MCSPDLYQGQCCICYGKLWPGTGLHEDCGDGRGGIHKGVCAILGGYYPNDELAYIGGMIIYFLHSMPSGQERQDADNNYHKWVYSIAEEDHYSADF